MKKYIFIFGIIGSLLTIIGCSDVKRDPGTIYMPDMAYSRAYESYADHSNLAAAGINYNNQPVKGTIARGEEFPFPYTKDAAGDTANYVAAKQAKSPIDSLSITDLKEAERLYLINCGICHGKNLDGNGPLYKDGNGPYPAKPANLAGDVKYQNMPEGQMFYSVAYGKNLMGSYASQLSRKQRWMVIKYIKTKQVKAAEPAAAMATASK
ncbi:c-type cytochrome [Parasediminibacterium sp. JCM 36343]|uniref:c-type cytochrome n=1 Tax=Parasediminibacterium sp. JCM 36343 TaxID=3374279 RepID=UPI00397D9D93